jgi:hypothetical protein
VFTRHGGPVKKTGVAVTRFGRIDRSRLGPIDFGQIDRSHVGSIGFGVVGPKRARCKAGDSQGPTTAVVRQTCPLVVSDLHNGLVVAAALWVETPRTYVSAPTIFIARSLRTPFSRADGWNSTHRACGKEPAVTFSFRPDPRQRGWGDARNQDTRLHDHDFVRAQLASHRAGWHNDFAEFGKMGCRARPAEHLGTSR